MILAPSILASDLGHLFAGGDPEAAVRSLVEAARLVP